MARHEFETVLEAHGQDGAWPLISIPFNVEEVYGTKARLSVKGALNGYPFKSSLFPNGDGSHHMMVNKQMRAGANAEVGDTVKVVLEPDTEPREVAIPDDLQTTLSADEQASTRFEKLPYSHKKEFVDWIEQAKKPETRASRIKKTVEMVNQSRRVNS